MNLRKLFFIVFSIMFLGVSGYALQSNMLKGKPVDFTGPKVLKNDYQRLFQQVWKHYGEGDGFSLSESKLQYQDIDLNSDGVPEVVFRFESGRYCNFYGCPTYIARKPYREDDVIFFSFSGGIEVLKEKENGYSVILDHNMEDVTFSYDREVKAYVADSVPSLAR
ncbi:MAG: hypothetical protein VX730_05020 [Pseudomonadota bacterium]|nr:hypothetical protein [Pseudomonadota bacterium]